MEYLLVMSLSGSTMTGIYLLLRCLLRKKGCARYCYWLAKAAVLYYLIPLPFLKEWYRKALRVVIPKKQTKNVQIPLRWKNYVVYGEEKPYLNIYAKLQITIIILWLLVACFLLLRQLLEYMQMIRLFQRYAGQEMTERQRAVLEPLKEEYKVKRHVTLYQGTGKEPTITFGVFRPIILCGRPLESREAELLVRHEMVHIKRWDVLWKILMQLVTFLHWWNLIMWLLYCDFERVCEWSCDETAMQERPEEEVREYLRLMIEEATDSGKPKKTRLRWRAGFDKNAKKLQERMENLMNRRKWNKAAAVALVAVLAFANSMTAFAYREPFQQELPEEASQEQIEHALTDDMFQFVFDDVGEEAMPESALPERTELLYEHQFVDEEGNIYQIPEVPAAVYRGCNHTFGWGTETRHHPYSDGSCEVRNYRSQMCTKCNYVIQGDLISSFYYAVCPH